MLNGDVLTEKGAFASWVHLVADQQIFYIKPRWGHTYRGGPSPSLATFLSARALFESQKNDTDLVLRFVPCYTG